MKLIKISTYATRGTSNNGDYDDDTAEKKDNCFWRQEVNSFALTHTRRS
jgi:hypothetical protein